MSVFLNDEPGTLASLTEILVHNDINLRAMSVADARDFDIVRIITDDPDATVAVFEQNGFVCSIRDVLTIRLDDKPGAMHKPFKTLGDAGSI